MRVSIRNIPLREDEQVVLECVELTKDFEDIRECALMRITYHRSRSVRHDA